MENYTIKLGVMFTLFIIYGITFAPFADAQSLSDQRISEIINILSTYVKEKDENENVRKAIEDLKSLPDSDQKYLIVLEIAIRSRPEKDFERIISAFLKIIQTIQFIELIYHIYQLLHLNFSSLIGIYQGVKDLELLEELETEIYNFFAAFKKVCFNGIAVGRTANHLMNVAGGNLKGNLKDVFNDRRGPQERAEMMCKAYQRSSRALKNNMDEARAQVKSQVEVDLEIAPTFVRKGDHQVKSVKVTGSGYTVKTYVIVLFPDGSEKYAYYNSTSFSPGDPLQFSDERRPLYDGTWDIQDSYWEWNVYTFTGNEAVGPWTWQFCYEDLNNPGYWLACDAETYIVAPQATLGLRKGWNMISSIGRDLAVEELLGVHFTDCKLTDGPYWWNSKRGEYIRADVLEPHKGYWLKVESDCLITFPAGEEIWRFNTLNDGWNMVSITFYPIPIQEFIDAVNILMIPESTIQKCAIAVFYYDPFNRKYIQPLIIEPEKGYWVFIGNCDITQSTLSAINILPPPIPPDPGNEGPPSAPGDGSEPPAIDAPIIAEVSIATLTIGDQRTMTILGTGFLQVTGLDFGPGVQVLDFTVVSDTQIDVTVSVEPTASPGPRDIILITSTGTFTFSGWITVEAPPWPQDLVVFREMDRCILTPRGGMALKMIMLRNERGGTGTVTVADIRPVGSGWQDFQLMRGLGPLSDGRLAVIMARGTCTSNDLAVEIVLDSGGVWSAQAEAERESIPSPPSSGSSRSRKPQVAVQTRAEGSLIAVTVQAPAPTACTRIAFHLYDLGGRPVAATESNGRRLLLGAWDRQGRPLANGVYLALVTVTIYDPQTDTEATVRQVRKVVVLRQR